MKKIALLIGNASYPDNELSNPVNDAISIDLKFKQLGIDTIIRNNLSLKNFNDAIQDFKQVLDNYEVGILFYAGHGMQIDGENYLCAIDTDFRDESFAKHSSIPLNLIIDILKKSKVYTKIFILDACRNNPYEINFRSTYRKGLAPIYAPIGTIIAFATSPGQTASDGGGDNGAYTESLLKHLDQQDLKIEELFKRTRNTLFALTKNKQLSWEHTSLMGDFYFSTSQLTGSYNSRYAVAALRDEEFNISGDKAIIDIIRMLKSHDWYAQNPAVSKINQSIFDTANINEIFVLGRNIFQAACGGARRAKEYLNNIKANLHPLTEEQKYHFLNGIIYETYFDSKGKLRLVFKNDYLNSIIPMLIEKEYQHSASFLKGKLDEFDFRVIYDVTGRNDPIFELVFEVCKSETYSLKEIRYKSINILYNLAGSEEPEDNEFQKQATRQSIKREISERIGAPESKVNCIFIGLPETIDRFNIPDSCNLLNYRIADNK